MPPIFSLCKRIRFVYERMAAPASVISDEEVRNELVTEYASAQLHRFTTVKGLRQWMIDGSSFAEQRALFGQA